MECPFCDPSVITKQRIHETEHTNVLYNIRPANKGQVLVVPKRHIENIRELGESESTDLILTVQAASEKIKQYLQPIAMNYGFNEGTHAGQSVSHYHFHILPRFEDDDVPEFHLFHRHPSQKRNLTNEELRPFVEEFRTLF